jgi:hypothetical protein
MISPSEICRANKGLSLSFHLVFMSAVISYAVYILISPTNIAFSLLSKQIKCTHTVRY